MPERAFPVCNKTTILEPKGLQQEKEMFSKEEIQEVTNKPYPGMDKRLTKQQALRGEEPKDWWEEDKKQEETAVFFDGVYFGEIPQELLRDPKIKLQAKAVYGLLHTYSQPKKLKNNPKTFVSQKRLSEDAGLTINSTILLCSI